MERALESVAESWGVPNSGGGKLRAYFHIADKVVQMDAYHARDITDQSPAALEGAFCPRLTAPGFHLPTGNRVIAPVWGQPNPEELPGGRLSAGAVEGQVLRQNRLLGG